jgi:hypothetical protein
LKRLENDIALIQSHEIGGPSDYTARFHLEMCDTFSDIRELASFVDPCNRLFVRRSALSPNTPGRHSLPMSKDPAICREWSRKGGLSHFAENLKRYIMDSIPIHR